MATKTKPALHVVGPDLEEMERVVTEAAQQSAPIVSRESTHRDRLTVVARDLTSERQSYVDRRTLLDRQYQAACEALDQQIADIDATLALYGSVSLSAAE